MDILYLVKESAENEELTYSLRTLVNLPHDRIFFAGGCPNNLKNIIHISIKQSGTKFENSTLNLITACKDERLSDNFILMNDDFFILNPVIYPERDLNLDRGYAEDVYNDYARRYPNQTIYMQGMEQTIKFLQGLGIAHPLSFELHIPMIMNKKNVLKMFNLKGVEKIVPLHKRTLYGNLFMDDTKTIEDNKILQKGIFIAGQEKDKQFLSCSDSGWERIKDFIKDSFPTPSKYEYN